jgi:hyperosmotically inducible periplasmic protein
MSLSQRIFFIVFSLAFALGFAGCQQERSTEKAGRKIDQAAKKAGEKTEEVRKTLGEKAKRADEYIGDAVITAKIKAEILSDPLLKVSQINVTTVNGVVKLSGLVDSQQSRDRAIKIAHSVKNVRSVKNGLVVKGSG